MKNSLTALEALLLLPLALLHALAIRLDRLLWPAPAPAVATAVVMPCAAPSPAAGRTAPPLADLTVHELRRVAQAAGIRSAGGRRASKARRADLLMALA